MHPFLLIFCCISVTALVQTGAACAQVLHAQSKDASAKTIAQSPAHSEGGSTSAALYDQINAQIGHPQIDTDDKPATNKRKQRAPVALGFYLGSLYGPSAIDLFDTYNEILGGPGAGFEASMMIGAATRIPAGDNFRISLSLESYSLRFTESFNQDIYPDGRGTPDNPLSPIGTRTLSEDMTVRVIPAFLSLEYMPVKAQFRTYAGVGVGAAFGWAFWSEAVSSTWADDPRSGGLHYDENYVAPAGRIYAGTQLGFDEHSKGSSLHSMFIEARYSFVATSLPIFDAIADQFEPRIPQLSDDFGLNAGGFSLIVGITIEFREPADDEQ